MRSLLSSLGSRKAVTILSQPALLASIAVSVLVIGVQQLGVLEQAELSFFDLLVRLRSDEELDPRLLVVAVTESDIQKLGE